MAVEPLAGKRAVQITAHRTRTDWAHFSADIAGSYRRANKITLVMDKLNTHIPGPLYNTFGPQVAKTWQLAEHGGDRTQRAHQGMPGSQDRQIQGYLGRSGRVAEAKKQPEFKDRLAVYQSGCPDQG
jgi:hypothetical protein